MAGSLRKPPFELHDGEQVVAHSAAAALHKLGATTGHLWLTSERVVFRPVVPWAFWILPPFGLVFYLMNRPQRRALPLATIGRRERTSFGRNRNVLVLGTRDMATRDLKIVVDSFDAFAAALDRQPALSLTP